jgi:hypothetical protein
MGASVRQNVHANEEVVILGTSPVLLIDGLMRARAGQRVLFLESSDQIGGAWAQADALGLSDVEAACHLIVNYRGVYDFLADECGIETESWSPQPLLLQGDRLTPFNSRSHVIRRSCSLLLRSAVVAGVRLVEKLILGGWQLSQTRDFRFSRAARSLDKRRLCPMFGSREHRAIRYPVGGSPAMIRTLCDKLRRHGARFRHVNAEAVTIPSEGGGVKITLDDGGELSTRSLVVSESCAIQQVHSEEGSRQFSEVKSTHTVLALRIRGTDRRPLSYVELPFDPVVTRVTDVTDYCRGDNPDGTQILICEAPDARQEGAPLPEPTEILSYLKSLKILSEGVEIVDFAHNHLELRRGDRSLVTHLRGLHSEALEFVPSGDFAYSIHRNRPRWEKLLSQSPKTNPESVSGESRSRSFPSSSALIDGTEVRNLSHD